MWYHDFPVRHFAVRESCCPQSFNNRDWYKKNLLGDTNTWPSSVRRQVLRCQQQNDLTHGGKTEQAYWPLWCPKTWVCHGTRVRPSGRLPSNLVRPVGSLEAGMPAEDSERTILSFLTLCLTILLGPACRSGRVAPEHPPWLHICKYEPRRCCNRDACIAPPYGQRHRWVYYYFLYPRK